MKEKVGEVFSIREENSPIKGLTISKEIYKGRNNITYFSLGEKTDISAEIYPYYKFLIIYKGIIEVYGKDCKLILKEGESVVTPINTPVGIKAKQDSVYTEILIRSDDIMNEIIKAGEIFKLKDIVPYQKDKIVNIDIVHNENMKFFIMAFDEGTGLSEHSAPGEALIFALDGEGIIGYEGKEYLIKNGESFHFAKNGSHYIKASKKFKMALLLILE